MMFFKKTQFYRYSVSLILKIWLTVVCLQIQFMVYGVQFFYRYM